MMVGQPTTTHQRHKVQPQRNPLINGFAARVVRKVAKYKQPGRIFFSFSQKVKAGLRLVCSKLGTIIVTFFPSMAYYREGRLGGGMRCNCTGAVPEKGGFPFGDDNCSVYYV